jgi:hypothetical protein
VTINEAVEISRRYCSDEAPTFINGILDHLRLLSARKYDRMSQLHNNTGEKPESQSGRARYQPQDIEQVNGAASGWKQNFR